MTLNLGSFNVYMIVYQWSRNDKPEFAFVLKIWTRLSVCFFLKKKKRKIFNFLLGSRKLVALGLLLKLHLRPTMNYVITLYFEGGDGRVINWKVRKDKNDTIKACLFLRGWSNGRMWGQSNKLKSEKLLYLPPPYVVECNENCHLRGKEG